MSDYFLDASALVKRYADEAGSAWMRRITESSAENTILLAEITLAEVAAALAAKARAPNSFSLTQRDRALSRFLQDCDEQFILLAVDRPVIERAVTLTQSHRLRGYDAVQLATALVAGQALETVQRTPPVFVASDEDLLAAASAEHLVTVSPLDHADPE